MAIDGVDWDIPDTPGNVAGFGYAGAGATARRSRRRGWSPSANAPHHAVVAAGSVGGKSSGEQTLARTLYPRPGPGLAADRRPQLLRLPRLERRRRRWRAAVVAGGGVGVAAAARAHPDGSYASVVFKRWIARGARTRLTEAARRGEDLDPDPAVVVRVVEYTVPDRERRRHDRPDRADHHHHRPARLRRRSWPRPITSGGNTRPATTSSRPTCAGRARSCGRASPTRPPGDLRLPADPLRDQRPDLPGRDRGRYRPRPGQVPAHRADRPPPGHRPGGLSPLNTADRSC